MSEVNAGSEAVAMMMRELICEQVFRERAKFEMDHPNTALGVRSITPKEAMSVTRDEYLAYGKDEWKSLAAVMLDKLILRRRTYWLSTKCGTHEKYAPNNPDEDTYSLGDSEPCIECCGLKCASVLIDIDKVTWCTCEKAVELEGKCGTCKNPFRPGDAVPR